jgi:integral membrane protein (TIGR01906 family)
MITPLGRLEPLRRRTVAWERKGLEGLLGLVRQVAALLFIIALPVALITTNIRIAVNEPRVYEYATDNYHTTATTGLPRSELLRASAEIRRYFNNDDERLSIRVREEGGTVALFSDREVAHMQDVKSLFRTAFRVQELSVLFVLGYVVMVFLWAREGSLRLLAREVLAAGVVSLATVVAFGGIVLAGFDAAFERFHTIAFNNDLWRLDPSRDRLIQMFPEAFWQDVTLWVGAATLAQLALLALGAAVYLRLTRREDELVLVHRVRVYDDDGRTVAAG